MGKNILFAIDIDGVIRDILSKMVSMYNADFETDVTNEDITEYDMKSGFPLLDDPCEHFFFHRARQVFLKSPVCPGAKEAVESLMEIGSVALVTKQTTMDAKRYTIEWLYRNGIPYDSLCFTGDDKGHLVDRFDWFVDDYHKNLAAANTPNKILVDAPYNKNVAADFDDRMRRVGSLAEFARFMKG